MSEDNGPAEAFRERVSRNFQRLLDENGAVGVSPRTVTNWRKDGMPGLDKILDTAVKLSVEDPATFFASEAKASFGAEVVTEAFQRLGPSDNAFVVAEPRLFRANPAQLVSVLRRSVERGTATVTYLYPAPLYDHTPPAAEEGPRPADIQFAVLESGLAHRLRGMMFDPYHTGIRSTSGMLVFLFRGSELKHLFQEIRGHEWNPTTQEWGELTWDRWMRVDPKEAQWIWERLERAILPGPNPDWWSDRLAGTIQARYREVLSDAQQRQYFETLRDVATPVNSERRILDVVKRVADKFPGEMLEIVEIGPADYRTSCDLIYEPLNSLSRPFHVTGVESAKAYERSRVAERAGQHGSIYTAKEKFEDWKPRGRRFHLAVALHSLYLIDPNQISKILSLLQPGGEAILLAGAYEGNVISELTGAIDLWLTPETNTGLGSIGRDPFRCYAEDIDEWFARNGLSSGRRIFKKRVPRESLVALRDGEPVFSEQGEQIAKYLLGDEADWGEWVKSDAAQGFLDSTLERESLEVVEWLFTVPRPKPALVTLLAGDQRLVEDGPEGDADVENKDIRPAERRARSRAVAEAPPSREPSSDQEGRIRPF